MRKVIALLGVLVLMLATAGASHAVLLSDLLNGGRMTSGDKLFDNWTLMGYMATDGRTFNAGNIDVKAIGSAPNPGISFTALNNELLIQGDDTFAAIDLQFSFRVSVLDPTMRIEDASVVISGGWMSWTVDQYNDLGMYIKEMIGTAPGLNDLGDLAASFDVLDDNENRAFSDSVSFFTPQSSLWITKNILVWAQDSTDSAELTSFDQNFSQIFSVPEPGMLSLLALGGMALLRFKRS